MVLAEEDKPITLKKDLKLQC